MEREAASASLRDVARAEQRTVEAIVYGRSGAVLILWGVTTAAAYVATQFYPMSARVVWPLTWCLSFAVTFVLLTRRMRGVGGSASALPWRIISAQAAFVVFGCLTIWILGPLDGRQLDAFWPLLFMLGYVLAGLWVGRFFLWCGMFVGALTITGYWLGGDWFSLWMAVVCGGALILGGLWLRRDGIKP